MGRLLPVFHVTRFLFPVYPVWSGMRLGLSGFSGTTMKHDATFRSLCRHVQADKIWANELQNPYLFDLKTSDSKILSFLKTHIPHKSPESSLSDFKSWVASNTGQIADAARDAIHIATSVQRDRAKHKRALAQLLLLNTHSECVKIAIQELRVLIPIFVVKKKKHPYPPARRWIVENQSIWDLWSYQIKHAPQPDIRISRKSMFMVDLAKLDYNIGPDESAIFEDENGKLVAMVISDFCKCEKVLHWVNEIVQLNVALEKNVRMSEPLYWNQLCANYPLEGRCRVYCHLWLVCWPAVLHAS